MDDHNPLPPVQNARCKRFDSTFCADSEFSWRLACNTAASARSTIKPYRLASTDAANLASIKVMERTGMSFWKRETTNGLDTVYFAISRADQLSEISEGGNRAED
jgi:hypothetical protein